MQADGIHANARRPAAAARKRLAEAQAAASCPGQTRKLACDTVVEGSSWKNIGSSRIRPAFAPEINVNEYPSLKELIERGLAIHSVRDAYVQMGKALTYGELDVLSAQFGAFLQTSCGLKKGDRVAVMMPNVLQYPIAVHGALRAGLHGRQHQSAVHRARARASARGFRRHRDRDPRELRARAAGSDRAHADQARGRHQRRRDARLPEGRHRQLRRAPQAQAGEALQPARRTGISGGAQGRLARSGCSR